MNLDVAPMGFLTLNDLYDAQKNEKNPIPPILTVVEQQHKEINGNEDVHKNIDVITKLYEAERSINKDNPANPLAIDLVLGEQVFVSTAEVPFKLGTLEHPSDSISIKPGEFALLLTHEEVHLPDSMFALISMKFSLKLKGLINVSGFHVDPGYEGRILYSVYNAGPNPIILTKEQKIFTIIFAKISNKSSRSNPKFNKLNFITPEHVAGLLGAPVSLQGLHDRIKTLEQWNKILIGVISGIAVALIAALLGKFGG